MSDSDRSENGSTLQYPDLTARLETLRNTSRRVSQPHHIVPNPDEHTAPEDRVQATTPYDITNKNQLQEWAALRPTEFLDILDSLRQERDLGVEASNSYLRLKNENWEGRYEKAKQKKKKLEKQLDRALRLVQPPGENQASSREGTPVSSQSGVKRSIKIPDPPVLTNGINPSWDE